MFIATVSPSIFTAPEYTVVQRNHATHPIFASANEIALWENFLPIKELWLYTSGAKEDPMP